MTENNTTTGYRVTDREGNVHEYPDAYDAFVNRFELILNDANSKTIAIFQRWDHVERIA